MTGHEKLECNPYTTGNPSLFTKANKMESPALPTQCSLLPLPKYCSYLSWVVNNTQVLCLMGFHLHKRWACLWVALKNTSKCRLPDHHWLWCLVFFSKIPGTRVNVTKNTKTTIKMARFFPATTAWSIVSGPVRLLLGLLLLDICLS